MTDLEIDKLLQDVHEAYAGLILSDSLIAQISDHSVKILYMEQLIDMIADLKMIERELKLKLEEYVEFSRIENLPINLSYRRILMKLQKSPL